MPDKIRILHVIKTLGLGGAEVNLLNLLGAIDLNQFELHVAYSFGGELEEKFKAAGARLFKYAQKDHKVKSLATAVIVARLSRYIWKNKIQIVHTHTFSAHLWASLAAKLTQCKIVEHVHDFRYMGPEDFIRRRGFNHQYKFVHRFKNISDRVIVLTRQNREFLIKEEIYPVERVRQYPNGIPLVNGLEKTGKTKQEFMSRFGLRPDNLVILSAVRVAPEKNVDLILRVAPEVIRRVPMAVFLIAGDGPLYKEMLKQKIEMGLTQNIRMIGYHADIRFLLRGADVFFLPSFLELHSIAILEAMSMKVPVVVSLDVGCNSEFIEHWKNGVLLDPFKDEGWAPALIKLLEDSKLRRDIGDNGYKTCLEKFNINEAAKRIESLYGELTRP